MSNEAETLLSNTQSAINFLKKTSVRKDGNQMLFDLPAFLAIGTAGCGKTTFFANTDTPYVFSRKIDKNKLTSIGPTQTCDWWVTKKAIFLDINGEYVKAPKNSNDNEQWQALLATIKKDKLGLQGVLLFIDAADLNDPKATINILKTRLNEVASFLKKPLTIYIVVTKLDRIIGFNEFFDCLDDKESSQPFALLFPENELINNPTDEFNRQYDSLLERLNNRVVSTLHQEYNPELKLAIKQFPTNMEQLRKSLSNVCHELSSVSIPGLKILGLYFTSSIQQSHAHHEIANIIQTSQNIQLYSDNVKKNRSFFSKHIIEKHILHAKPDVKENDIGKWVRGGIFGLIILIVIIACAYFGYSFKQQLHDIQLADNAIVRYQVFSEKQNVSQQNISDNIPVLNALMQGVQAMQDINHVGFIHFHSHERQITYQKLIKTYKTALAQAFIPNLTQLLEQQLTTASQTPNDDDQLNLIYGTLKAYLMLGKGTTQNPLFMQTWMQNYWLQKYSDNPLLATQLLKQLNMLFVIGFDPVKLDQDAIAKARAILQQMPNDQLAYIILKNSDVDDMMNIFNLKGDDLQLFSTPVIDLEIPRIFTASGYINIYQKQIQSSVLEGILGDTITGGKPSPANLSKEQQQVFSQVSLSYANDYAQVWNSLANNLKFKSFANIKQAITALNLLSKDNSPLIKIISAIATNTDFGTNDILFASLAKKYEPLHALIENNKPTKSLSDLLIQLKQTSAYLSDLAFDKDPQQAIFVSTEQRFNKSDDDTIDNLFAAANTVPAPLQQYTTSFANNVWSLLLKQTTDYINDAWQQQVGSFYKANIENRFPVDAKATQDIQLNNFTQYFGPKGLVDTFFSDYLATFVDMSHDPWKFKMVNGGTINIPMSQLLQIRRSKIIQQMYFADGATQLNTPFSLQSAAWSPNVKNFSIDMNGEKASFSNQVMQSLSPVPNQPQQTQSHDFVWPGDNSAGQVILSIETFDKGRQSTTFNGPWALFRALQASQLAPTEDPHRFEVMFDINDNQVKFFLVSKDAINPFIPKIIEGYREI